MSDVPGPATPSSETESTGAPTVATTTSAPSAPAPSLFVPKPGQLGRTDFTDEATYRKNRNRLANYRWPVGEEADPNMPGTSERDDGWVNLKLDITEHPDPDPNQRDLLHGGPELKLPCGICNAKMHVAASKKVKDVLTEGGFNVSRADIKNLDKEVVAVVCENGHLSQFRSDVIEQLIKHD